MLIILALILVFAFVTFYFSLFWGWMAALTMATVYWLSAGITHPVLFTIFLLVFGSLTIGLNFPPVRRVFLTRRIMKIMGRMLPQIGETEKIALEAGTVWWDQDLFSGSPNWSKLMDYPVKDLSQEEKDFLEGPVNELCGMIDDWAITCDGDLSPKVWKFLEKKKFFGMIIPKEFGGLGFSAQAHSLVVTRVASRSLAAAVTVMVPNSLGPAELLLHYGTDEQKKKFLPRLASGKEIPCFALTEPTAGSDAASGKSHGVVCHGEYDGQEVLGMRLNWEKRYTTLGPVSTLIGLSFRLSDPNELLGKKKDLGITVALVPSNLAGIDIGQRHNPLECAFHNGPTTGNDVFVPLDFIIGGKEMAGQGWRMLMDCLSAGRSISLPAMSTGIAQKVTRGISAYARIREQFNLPIGKFEGIEERLARIASFNYMAESARWLTAGAVDSGEKPSVVSAIMKAYMTECMRTLVNDAMDIQAGGAISLGPRNFMGGIYQSAPISITVEGANILTRSMIIYGQGAIRCHPFIQEEIKAIETNDLARFDRAFFGHIALSSRNKIRAFLMGVFAARLPVKGVSPNLPYASLLRNLTRFSAAYAFLSDVLMSVLGGALKRKEKISGRMADALAWMYLASASAKRFAADGNPKSELPFLLWIGSFALYQIQQALRGVIDNFPIRWMRPALRVIIFPLGARIQPPSDRLGATVAQTILDQPEIREKVTSHSFLPNEKEKGMGHLEGTYREIIQNEKVLEKLKEALRSGKLSKKSGAQLYSDAVDQGILTETEKKNLLRLDEMKREAIEVDAFSQESFKRAFDQSESGTSKTSGTRRKTKKGHGTPTMTV